MIQHVDEFQPVRVSKEINLLKRPVGQRKKYADAPDYLDIIGAFDIETSTIYKPDADGAPHPHAFMYIWQYQIGRDYTIIGRTWDELRELLAKLEKMAVYVGIRYNVIKTPVLVTYIHNLAYEFQYLLGQFPIQNTDCFFKKERKPLYCKIGNIEFRDSLALSNMSLKKFAENVGCTVRKQSGQKFDYSKLRFPWTPLTPEEIEYCIDDVITLREAVERMLVMNRDTLYTVPLTNTGFVRRDCKKAILPIRESINAMLPREDEYRLLRRAFRGGNTHANRYHVGEIVENVYSYDIRSSYPTQQLTRPFPMERFKWIDGGDMERIQRFIDRGYCVVGDYQFKNLRLRDKTEPVPYISYGCCDAIRPVLDNGRILSADYVEISLTEIDLMIVLDQYTADFINCTDAMIARAGMLPAAYRGVIMDYYREKTILKGEPGKEYELAKSKNRLNAIYGMSSQDPIHETITLNPDHSYTVSDYEDEISAKNLLKASFPYQWGVYCTAWARFALHLAMRQVPKDARGISKLLYCDTDSIKTLGPVDLSDLNEKLESNARKYNAVAPDRNGKPKYIGIFTPDGVYDRFITQGAKRYAYETPAGIHVTVSGVSHAEHEYYDENGELDHVTEWASEELGSLENFRPGFIWRTKAGGTTIVYNDNDDFDYTDPETGNVVHITANAAIVDTTYEMKRTDDYISLLKMCELYIEYKKQFE